MAQEDGAVRGVLPLMEMRSAIFGRFLVSLPFLNYGGILADTPEVESGLAQAAIDLATRGGASHIELRQEFPSGGPLEGWVLRQHKAALIVNLAATPKLHWDGLSSRLRGKIRKAENNGTEFTTGGRELLSDFYFLYSLNMRDLGTPVYCRAFFENIFAKSDDTTRVLLVRHQNRRAAAAIAIRRGGRIELPWICQNYGESGFNVNEFLYWKAIEWACSQGASLLDLGRSSVDSGPYRFKMQWKPEVRGLFWYYWMAPGVPLPQLNPDNPKFKLAAACWRKLPLGVANRIGPWIVRGIP